MFFLLFLVVFFGKKELTVVFLCLEDVFFGRFLIFFLAGKDKEGKGICFVSLIGEVGLGWHMLFGFAKFCSSLIAF